MALIVEYINTRSGSAGEKFSNFQKPKKKEQNASFEPSELRIYTQPLIDFPLARQALKFSLLNFFGVFRLRAHTPKHFSPAAVLLLSSQWKLFSALKPTLNYQKGKHPPSPSLEKHPHDDTHNNKHHTLLLLRINFHHIVASLSSGVKALVGHNDRRSMCLTALL